MTQYSPWIDASLHADPENVRMYAHARLEYIKPLHKENLEGAKILLVRWKLSVSPVMVFFFAQAGTNRGFIVEDSNTTKSPKLIFPFWKLKR